MKFADCHLIQCENWFFNPFLALIFHLKQFNIQFPGTTNEGSSSNCDLGREGNFFPRNKALPIDSNRGTNRTIIDWLWSSGVQPGSGANFIYLGLIGATWSNNSEGSSVLGCGNPRWPAPGRSGPIQPTPVNTDLPCWCYDNTGQFFTLTAPPPHLQKFWVKVDIGHPVYYEKELGSAKLAGTVMWCFTS